MRVTRDQMYVVILGGNTTLEEKIYIYLYLKHLRLQLTHSAQISWEQFDILSLDNLIINEWDSVASYNIYSYQDIVSSLVNIRYTRSVVEPNTGKTASFILKEGYFLLSYAFVNVVYDYNWQRYSMNEHLSKLKWSPTMYHESGVPMLMGTMFDEYYLFKTKFGDRPTLSLSFFQKERFQRCLSEIKGADNIDYINSSCNFIFNNIIDQTEDSHLFYRGDQSWEINKIRLLDLLFPMSVEDDTEHIFDYIKSLSQFSSNLATLARYSNFNSLYPFTSDVPGVDSYLSEFITSVYRVPFLQIVNNSIVSASATDVLTQGSMRSALSPSFQTPSVYNRGLRPIQYIY